MACATGVEGGGVGVDRAGVGVGADSTGVGLDVGAAVLVTSGGVDWEEVVGEEVEHAASISALAISAASKRATNVILPAVA